MPRDNQSTGTEQPYPPNWPDSHDPTGPPSTEELLGEGRTRTELFSRLRPKYGAKTIIPNFIIWWYGGSRKWGVTSDARGRVLNLGTVTIYPLGYWWGNDD